MNKSRLILLGVALVAGGGAFYMVATGEDAMSQQIAQAVPVDRGPEMVRVLVADQTFGRGDRIDPAMTHWVKWPKDDLPEHLVTDEDEAFYESLSSLRAKTTIYQGEPLIKAKVVAQGDRGMMAALLAPGMRAMTANIGGQATQAGFVLPGDVVDVMATERDSESTTAIAFEGLRVLAIDNTLQQEMGPNALPGATVTFELRPDQVKKFITLRETTDFTLVLRSIFDAEVPNVPSSEVIVLRYNSAGRG